MRTAWCLSHLLCLTFAGSIGPLFPTRKVHSGLESYKYIPSAWGRKEIPSCWSHQCPHSANFTWDFYWDQILKLGVRNLVLGGCKFYVPGKLRCWRRSKLAALKERVASRGGKILVDLDFDGPFNLFNETLIVNTIHKLSKYYSGVGIRVTYGPEYFDKRSMVKILKLAVETVNKLNMISAIRSELGINYLGPSDWNILKQSGLLRIVKLMFVDVVAWPKRTPLFITDKFSEDLIANATRAGLDTDRMILQINPCTPQINGDDTMGYANMILDAHCDPNGNGTCKFYEMYFNYFPQHLIKSKIPLAKKHGLHGLSMDRNYPEQTDLLPWDQRSMFYTLFTNM
ncbi:hypothetical protein Pmar_PMAR000079 [Perkinsus marinus ATCC 50983]|uniref:Uncharacterized protein n=1 Tax=Perkinsus marinus (strain ATCC 50983 / TXsc) TaxID=423536 RepID=C5KPU5_PERM5|nr:hypothetical protein Pmar_PMAR000079 [Perkinsus marinus ATCC 50983]EER13492.1 hypothetical protein Pmar_PMAR000079 [Perkinsus marinus ATCC 50983]|eukprot:XP_002781697.1 hypothetical protein Pmar_PMAR000079 [Perkinsus marinus ATCC 50983]